MSEVKLFNHIRSRMAEKARLTRIENIVAEGTPDVNCCMLGHEFWIELKDAPAAKRETSLLLGRSHKLTPQQVNFWRAQRRHGGHAFVLVRYGGTEFFLFDDWLNINEFTVQQARENSLFFTPKIVDIFARILAEIQQKA